jgi:hypothetical protein
VANIFLVSRGGCGAVDEEEEEEEEEEEVKAEVEFNPFPCTWFLGADYLCNSTTWISG